MKIFSHSFLPITKLRKDNACYPSKQKRTKRAPTRQRPEKWYKWVSSKWRNLTQIEKTIPFFASSNTDLLNEVARFGVRSKSSGSKSHLKFDYFLLRGKNGKPTWLSLSSNGEILLKLKKLYHFSQVQTQIFWTR